MKKIWFVLFVLLSCRKAGDPNPPVPAPEAGYEQIPEARPLTGARIDEASGIADSRSRPGFLWVHEDKSNAPMLWVLRHDGAVTDSVFLEGAVNRDWEDMVLGPGPAEGTDYLYVGDIGDNDTAYADYAVYRFAEPAPGVSRVSLIARIAFAYPDGPHDAEALLADPVNRDLYVITKRDARSKVYRIGYPQQTAQMNEAVFVADLGYTGVVSAALSHDGKEVIIKTYSTLYHYTAAPGETLDRVLARTPATLGYQREAQGEAVGFAVAGNGFFTLGEEAGGFIPQLNFYRRK